MIWLVHSAEEHGQVGEELGEPYYLYGKSLLELVRCSALISVCVCVEVSSLSWRGLVSLFFTGDGSNKYYVHIAS